MMVYWVCVMWGELMVVFFGVAYYVAFGPHGPRAPTSQPGDNLKIFLATMGLVGVAAVLGTVIHKWGGLFSCA